MCLWRHFGFKDNQRSPELLDGYPAIALHLPDAIDQNPPGLQIFSINGSPGLRKPA